MIQITNVETFGWESAIRGMRNPKNSWDMSDSYFHEDVDSSGYTYRQMDKVDGVTSPWMTLGDSDLKLMKSLSKAGSDHGKYLRMINVTMDINAPLYWWKEFDTYKVGTVANSCSTMHKIHAKEFTLDDFSHEHLDSNRKFELARNNTEAMGCCVTPKSLLEVTCSILNQYREAFVKTKNKGFWWQMIQLLPSSYNQLRTVQLNYQVLKNMYRSRKNHKLDEWRDFCDRIKTLPYSELITGEESE